MTITISRNSFWEIFFEDEPTKRRYDPADELDILWQFPSQFGEGQSRAIKLRDGLGLVIRDCRLYDRLILKVAERQGNAVQCGCYLAGGIESWGVHQGNYGITGAGEHYFLGSGIRPGEVGAHLAQHHLLVEAWMSPELFASFAGSLDGEIPLELQHLVRQPAQERYSRNGITSQAMQEVAQKILHCPYWGITKRFYLESKALELMALLLEEETAIQTEQQPVYFLNPDQIARIHHAKEILLHQLDNPPSLTQLARRVGLNECTLKRGFRQVFGKTAFKYLHDHRLEQARQLLKTGDMSVVEVSLTVGFASHSYFAAAFRKKFGINPKEYQKQQRNSV